jgi:hypothetical protein
VRELTQAGVLSRLTIGAVGDRSKRSTLPGSLLFGPARGGITRISALPPKLFAPELGALIIVAVVEASVVACGV